MGSKHSKPADVAAYVDRLCGGVDNCRVMVGDAGRVVVADAPTWTDDMSQCVKGRFPGVTLSICQCNSSMSGFSVVIELPVHRDVHGWQTVVYVVFIVISS